MTPQRIQLRRAKGFQLPPNTVKVDRSTRWGNPFKEPPFNPHTSIRAMDGRQKYPVQMFRHMLLQNRRWMMPASAKFACVETTIEDVKRELAGKNLACWCRPGKPCHADVLLEIANDMPPPAYLVKDAKPTPALEAGIARMKELKRR